jgi:hypothetical protein
LPGLEIGHSVVCLFFNKFCNIQTELEIRRLKISFAGSNSFPKGDLSMLTLRRYRFDSPDNPGPDLLLKMNESLRTCLRELDFSQAAHREILSSILEFQEEEGSFRYFDSWKVSSEIRVDFCYTPTYLCAALLMKYYLYLCAGPEAAPPEIKTALAKALQASCGRELCGHGYEGVAGQIEALRIFIGAGLGEFLQKHSALCPAFSQMIRKISAEFSAALAAGQAGGGWGEDYSADFKEILQALPLDRYYLAYGINMNSAQMKSRCPEARKIKALYLPDYQLRFHKHATIEKKKGQRVPALLWILNPDEEKKLDGYEGVGSGIYRKDYVQVEAPAGPVRAMVYIMTEKGIEEKGENRRPFDDYYQAIACAYQAEGLDMAPLRAARARAKEE